MTHGFGWTLLRLLQSRQLEYPYGDRFLEQRSPDYEEALVNELNRVVGRYALHEEVLSVLRSGIVDIVDRRHVEIEMTVEGWTLMTDEQREHLYGQARDQTADALGIGRGLLRTLLHYADESEAPSRRRGIRLPPSED